MQNLIKVLLIEVVFILRLTKTSFLRASVLEEQTQLAPLNSQEHEEAKEAKRDSLGKVFLYITCFFFCIFKDCAGFRGSFKLPCKIFV